MSDLSSEHPDDGEPDLDLKRVGRYEIVSKLAEGGMGAVYVARQDNPNRTVALKLIRSDLTRPEYFKRFAHEAEILGRLQHPGIAQIYEAGQAEATGGRTQPFFAMELVEGKPLGEYAAHQELGTRDRVRLVELVADAVQHAHERGVIHRDLKPGNILITDSGQPKVLDFGVARLTDSDVQLTTMHTDVGQMLGTLPYMSPEQIAADPLELDTRSDVYALGVILYELLAGRLPYEVRGEMLHEAARIIREVDPVPLSSTNRTLRGDLDTIVTKALEKDKTRRYESAAELSADLEAYLDDRPIRARPPSRTYLLEKFARRHKALVAGSVAVSLALVAGTVVSVVQASRATRAEGVAVDRLEEVAAAERLANERREEAERNAALAEREAAKAHATLDFVRNMLYSADPGVSGQRDVPVGELLDRASIALDAGGVVADADVADEVRAALRHILGVTYTTLGRYVDALPHLREALAAREAQYGEGSPEAAEVEIALARALLSANDFDEAGRRIEHALATRRGAFGELSSQHAADLGALATLRYNQGRNAEALETERRSLAIHREVDGERSAVVAAALTSMGGYLVYERRNEEAREMLEEAVSIFTETHGDAHPRAFSANRKLAQALRGLGRSGEAEARMQVGLELARSLWGEEHLNVANILTDLADLHRGRGAFAAAERETRAALAIRRRALGAHRDTATSLSVLGSLLGELGRPEEAQAALAESLAMRRQVFGDESAATADSLQRLAHESARRGDFDRAESSYREALAIWEDTLGPDHADVGALLLALGKLLRHRGAYEEAREAFERVHAIHSAVADRGHRSVLEVEDELAQLLIEMGAYEDAERFLRATLEWALGARSAGHVLVAHMRLQYGAALAGLGRFEEAEEWMLPSWERVRDDARIWGETKLQALGHLAFLYERWEKHETAAEFREQMEAYR